VFVDARGLEAELAVEPDQTEREEVGEEGADDRLFASGSPVAVAGEFVGSEEPMEPAEPEESVVRLEGPSREPLEVEAAREVAEADAEAEAEVAAEAEREDLRDEPVVSIPRPDPADVQKEIAQKENAAKEDAQKEPGQAAVRQQRLFGAGLDEALVAEATETVTSWGRASATFLQRKLRIDYELACQLMVELGARGVVELEADASRGRVLQ